MKNHLTQLEAELPQAFNSDLSEAKKNQLPPNLQLFYNHKIFGGDLLAVPAKLLIPGEDEEFESPFCFMDDNDWLDMFEEEYREEIPEEFIPFGTILGSEVVLLNTERNSVHVFHVSDIGDSEWIAQLLDKGICDLETFVQNIRPQTVSCFLKSGSEYESIEIRNPAMLKTFDDEIQYPDEKAVREAYLDQAKRWLEEGYELHYAPAWVREVIAYEPRK